MKLRTPKDKYDYFGAIDRMGDSFIPKVKNTAYKEINFGIPIISVDKPMVDPYPMTADRQYNRFMHMGPAPSKQINNKQIKELIHEMKERKFRPAKTKEEIKEIKNLSKKFMNKPWAAVPEKYRNKYGMLDFDRDGVPNAFDCYPFDYDRQATVYFYTTASGKTGVTTTPTSNTGVNLSTGKAIAGSTASKTGTYHAVSSGSGSSSGSSSSSSAASKTIVGPVTTYKSSSGATVYQYTYKDSSGKTWSTDTIKNPATDSSIKSGSSSSSGSTGSNTTLTTIKPYTPEYGWGVVAPGYNVDPSGKVIQTMYRGSLKGDEISYDGGKTWQLVTPDLPSPGNPKTSGSGGTSTTTSITPNIPAPAVDYFTAYLDQYVPNWQTMTDYEKYNALYEQILSGKISDPQFIAKYNEMLKPYLDQYKRSIMGAQSAITLKSKQQALLGGVGGDILRSRYTERAANILQRRVDIARARAETKSAEVQKQKETEIVALAKKELEMKKPEYTSKVDIGGTTTRTTYSNLTQSELAKLQQQYGSNLKYEKLLGK